MPTSSNFKFLVVEDDAPKLNAILAVLAEVHPGAKVFTAGSVASAVNLIASEKIDFAVLDMSLPAFDIVNDLAGSGQPQDFGGRDILRFLEDMQEGVQSVILTQYEEFNAERALFEKRDLASISAELLDEFCDTLMGVIYYSGRRGDWREKLKKLIAILEK